MKIAVLCAFNPNNTGMYTVDLAAREFFAGRRGLDWTLACAQHPARGARLALGGLRFAILREAADLAAFDRVVHWGDFQNNSAYGAHDFANREVAFGYARDPAEGFAHWRRVNLLEGVPGAARRAVSVGNNFQDLPDGGGPEAARIDAALAANFRAILPRDPASIARLAAVHPGAAGGRVLPGLDAAFLLAAPPPPAFWRLGPSLAWHFGRARLAAPEALVGAVARRTGLAPVHLARWFRLGPRSAGLHVARMRAELRAARLVLTDVYHVAVNALALGRPVLLVARAADAQRGTLGEYKKRTLLGMLGLADWLHEIPEDAPGPDPEALAGHAARLLAAGDAPERLAPLRARTAEFRARLEAEILSDAPA